MVTVNMSTWYSDHLWKWQKIIFFRNWWFLISLAQSVNMFLKTPSRTRLITLNYATLTKINQYHQQTPRPLHQSPNSEFGHWRKELSGLPPFTMDFQVELFKDNQTKSFFPWPFSTLKNLPISFDSVTLFTTFCPHRVAGLPWSLTHILSIYPHPRRKERSSSISRMTQNILFNNTF
jgi:hypothetical protein